MTVITFSADDAYKTLPTGGARWDATETASRLWLLLGLDLQFIRINGTVMGAVIRFICTPSAWP
jgi:hypothetical protein